MFSISFFILNKQPTLKPYSFLTISLCLSANKIDTRFDNMTKLMIRNTFDGNTPKVQIGILNLLKVTNVVAAPRA